MPEPGAAAGLDSVPAVPAGVSDPGTHSISCGAANRGALYNAVEMPQQGVGFEIPDPWWSRGHRFATGELIALITRATATVDAAYPGGVLGVADLSRSTGGALPGHRSHQSGRDADLIFYALDAQGNPFRPDEHMGYYTYSGRARYAKAPVWTRTIPERNFDLARNWELVKAMVTDRDVVVEHIFISRRVRRWLLDYAKRSGEDEGLIKRAAMVMKQAPGTAGHNDHMHVRVACTADDVTRGRCKSNIVRREGHRKFYSRIRCPSRSPAVARAALSPASAAVEPSGSQATQAAFSPAQK